MAAIQFVPVWRSVDRCSLPLPRLRILIPNPRQHPPPGPSRSCATQSPTLSSSPRGNSRLRFALSVIVIVLLPVMQAQTQAFASAFQHCVGLVAHARTHRTSPLNRIPRLGGLSASAPANPPVRRGHQSGPNGVACSKATPPATLRSAFSASGRRCDRSRNSRNSFPAAGSRNWRIVSSRSAVIVALNSETRSMAFAAELGAGPWTADRGMGRSSPPRHRGQMANKPRVSISSGPGLLSGNPPRSPAP